MLQGMFCVTHVKRDSCYTFSVLRVKSSTIHKSLVNIFIDGEYVGGNKKMTNLLAMDIWQKHNNEALAWLMLQHHY